MFEHCLATAPAAPPAIAPLAELQARVQPWMLACFGAVVASDKVERNHRFLEESLELVQACGCTTSEAHQLVEYVYGRPAGDAKQEVGGVMITLAALCLANGFDMHAAGETELARIWTKVDQIRAKQAAKPPHSPLPAEPIAAIAPDALQPRYDLIELATRLESCARRGSLLSSEETAMRDAATMLRTVAAVSTQIAAMRAATGDDAELCKQLRTGPLFHGRDVLYQAATRIESLSAQLHEARLRIADKNSQISDLGAKNAEQGRRLEAAERELAELREMAGKYGQGSRARLSQLEDAARKPNAGELK